MKIGYSILLGEVLSGKDIDYDDCRRLQIVCTNCQEPVFKVHREPGARKGADYFAHYNRKFSVEADCSARVASHVTVDHEQQNAISRKQRLDYFLSVLPTAIARHPVFQEGGAGIVRSIARQAGYRECRSRLIDGIKKRCPATHRNWLFDDAAKYFSENAAEARDDLPEAVRFRIARELFDLLMRPIAKHALTQVLDLVLFQYAMICREDIRQDVHGLDHDYDSSRIFYDIYQEFSKARRRSVNAILNRYQSFTAPNYLITAEGRVDAPTHFDVFCNLSLNTLVGVLSSQPYSAILRDRYGDATVEREYLPVYGDAPEVLSAVNPVHDNDYTVVHRLAGR